MSDTRTEIEDIKRTLGDLAARVRVLRFGQQEAEEQAERELMAAEQAIDAASHHLTTASALPLYALDGPLICTGNQQ